MASLHLPQRPSRRKSSGELGGSPKKQALSSQCLNSGPPGPKLTRSALLLHLQRAEQEGGFSSFTEADWESRYGGKVRLPALPDDFNSARHSLPDLDNRLGLERETQCLLFHRILEGYIRTQNMLPQGSGNVSYLLIQASVLETFGLLTASSGKTGIAISIPDRPLSAVAKALGDGRMEQGAAKEEGPNYASQLLEDEQVSDKESRIWRGRQLVGQEHSEASSSGRPQFYLIGEEDLKLSFEEYLKGNFFKGHFDFVIHEKVSGNLLGVIEVTRPLSSQSPKDCLFQLFSQMCALLEINARNCWADSVRMSKAELEAQEWEVWGILTDGDDWLFATLNASVTLVRRDKKRIGIKWGKSSIKLSRLYNLFSKGEGTRDSGTCLSCLARFLAPQIDQLTTAEVAKLFEESDNRLEGRVALGMDSFDKFHKVSPNVGTGTFAERLQFWLAKKRDCKEQRSELPSAAAVEESMDNILDRLDCGAYKKRFKDEKLQLDMIGMLTDADFAVLGVVMDDRIKIRRAFEELHH